MRTVLSGICLFNDPDQIKRTHFYIKWKRRGREQDSRETERECVCETACGGNGKIASVVKMNVGEKHLGRSNVGLICKIIEIQERR
jgi:hypothetical protein